VQTRAATAAAREGAGGGAGDAAGGAPDSPDSEGAGVGPGDGEGADAAATPAQSLQLQNARLRSELAEQVRRPRGRPASGLERFRSHWPAASTRMAAIPYAAARLSARLGPWLSSGACSRAGRAAQLVWLSRNRSNSHGRAASLLVLEAAWFQTEAGLLPAAAQRPRPAQVAARAAAELEAGDRAADLADRPAGAGDGGGGGGGGTAAAAAFRAALAAREELSGQLDAELAAARSQAAAYEARCVPQPRAGPGARTPRGSAAWLAGHASCFVPLGLGVIRCRGAALYCAETHGPARSACWRPDRQG